MNDWCLILLLVGCAMGWIVRGIDQDGWRW